MSSFALMRHINNEQTLHKKNQLGTLKTTFNIFFCNVLNKIDNILFLNKFKNNDQFMYFRK